jgi:hypothetical protein
VLEGKEATDIRLATMVVVVESRGGLEKLTVHGDGRGGGDLPGAGPRGAPLPPIPGGL